MDNELIKFTRIKNFTFLNDLGKGATGITKLIRDETIYERFVCKKYSTHNSIHQDTYYKNFVDEIKILYKINHTNIVRVFNYYLYPESTTGYIIMEYIEGDEISEYIRKHPNQINTIFEQTIEGFKYLESKNILHRDIRPSNLLVSNNGEVKTIDFGFGKVIGSNEEYNKSISLNWRYSIPDEFKTDLFL